MENNNNQQNIQFNNDPSVKETEIMYTREHVAMLEKKISELEAQSQFRLEDMHRFKTRYESVANSKREILDAVHKLFAEVLSNDESFIDDYSDHYDTLVELGMDELKKKLEFSFTYVVTVSGNAMVPYSFNAEEYDSEYFCDEIDEDSFGGELMNVGDDIDINVEVNERTYDRTWELSADI